jgi:signal recognition particle subunit SRP54
MVGLQGGGKTTTTAKIAKRLKERDKRVLMASLDVNRPAAMEQLAILGEQIGVDTLPIVKGETPSPSPNAPRRKRASAATTSHARHRRPAVHRRRAHGRGRGRPRRRQPARDAAGGRRPHRSGRGQPARSFDERIGITGLVLTRMDGDGRGGAALSMRAVTGKPIKLLGTGEKLDALEDFHPEPHRLRILGMGDVVALVRSCPDHRGRKGAAHDAKRFQKGQFDHERPHRPAQADAEDGRHVRT